MKRRTFLSATSTIGIVGVASSATIASAVYNNLSTSVLLEEFDDTSKKVLNKFVSDISVGTESLGLDSKFAKRIAMPMQIISNKSTKDGQTIIYKNKCGRYVVLTGKNGTGKVKVLSEI